MGIESAGEEAAYNYDEFAQYPIEEEPDFGVNESHELPMYDVRLPVIGDDSSRRDPYLYQETIHREPSDQDYLSQQPYEQTSSDADLSVPPELMDHLSYGSSQTTEDLRARYPELFNIQEPDLRLSRFLELPMIEKIRYVYVEGQPPIEEAEEQEPPTTPTENSYPSPHFQRHDQIPVEGEE